MRVLHVDYQQLRRYDRQLRTSWVEKLAYGMIRNDHYVHSFSDRDVAAFEAPLGLRDLGYGRANKRLLELALAVEPDLLVIGHSDIISNKTLKKIRAGLPAIRMAHCNVDAIFVPHNVERIRRRAEVVDAVFVSTGRRELEQFAGLGARLYYLPNPVDASIEVLDNSQKTDLPVDLLFCSNGIKHSTRGVTVEHLKNALGKELNFQLHGDFGGPPIWGRDYDRALAQTRMSLNLNRQEGNYWYSSDRMAQLAGNGILQFTHSAQGFQDLLPPETVVYFDDNDDLVKKVREFHHDDARRRAWAARARAFFHTEMCSALFSRYIVEATFMLPFSHDYVWARNINRDGTLK